MAGEDGGSDEARGATSDAELSRRLQSLSRDLDAERRERAVAARAEGAARAGYGQAFRLSSEFIAGIVVGAVLGWGLDRAAGTSPWGLMVFLLLGFGAGILNVVRAAGKTTASRPDGGDETGGRQ